MKRLLFRLLRHPRFWLTVGLLGVDGGYFTLTNPSKVVSTGLIGGFLLLALTIYYLFGSLLAAISAYLSTPTLAYKK